MITNNTTNTKKRETNVKVRSSAQVIYKKTTKSLTGESFRTALIANSVSFRFLLLI